MITVETTETDVRVIIPKNTLSPEQLTAFVDWLRFEEIAQGSQLNEEQADRLAEEIKADWWAANKKKLISPSEG